MFHSRVLSTSSVYSRPSNSPFSTRRLSRYLGYIAYTPPPPPAPPSFHHRGDIQHKTAREILSSLSKWVPIKRAEFTADEIVFIIERASARVMRLAISKIRFVHLPRKMAIVVDETKGKNLTPKSTRAKGRKNFSSTLLKQSAIMQFSLRKVFVTRLSGRREIMRGEFNLLQGRGGREGQILKRNKWTLRGRLEKENTWEFNIIFKGKTPVSVAPFSTVGGKGRKGVVTCRGKCRARPSTVDLRRILCLAKHKPPPSRPENLSFHVRGIDLQALLNRDSPGVTRFLANNSAQR